MSDKNPFEIRLEVLQMAKDYLDKQLEINTDYAMANFQELVKMGTKLPSMWESYAPKQYTTEELMAKATEFYSFITNKK